MPRCRHGPPQAATDAPHNLPVLEDLRGRFRNRLEAYSWQFANLWPKTTHRMLIGISPTLSVGVNPELRDEWKEILRENRPISNASNREVRELDLTPFLGGSAVYLRFRDSHPEDGWGAAVGEVVVRADGKEVARFTPPAESEKPFLYDSGGSGTSPGSGGHRFADNDRRFVYKIVPPEGTKRLIASVDIWNQFEVSAQGREPARTHVEVPNAYMRDYAIANRAMAFWLDPNVKEERVLMERIMSDVEPYTPYLGWFAQDVAGEFGGTELASRHGVYILAADWFENMSVFSAARASVEPPKAPPVPKLENKVISHLRGDRGDNLSTTSTRCEGCGTTRPAGVCRSHGPQHRCCWKPRQASLDTISGRRLRTTCSLPVHPARDISTRTPGPTRRSGCSPDRPDATCSAPG